MGCYGKDRYGYIDEFLGDNNSYKVGIIDGFVKADLQRPFIYTTDILTCIVLLIIMDKEAWMIHLDVNNVMYNKIINEFLNSNDNIIHNVYVFPGIKSNPLIISDIENIFLDNNINYCRSNSYYDDRYGNMVGSIGYKYDNKELYLFGVDSDGYICYYDLNHLSLNKKNKQTFVRKNLDKASLVYYN